MLYVIFVHRMASNFSFIAKFLRKKGGRRPGPGPCSRPFPLEGPNLGGIEHVPTYVYISLSLSNIHRLRLPREKGRIVASMEGLSDLTETLRLSASLLFRAKYACSFHRYKPS